MLKLLQKLTFFLCIASTVAQVKFPPVENFNVKDYAAGNQNWGIDIADNYVYVANNEGLLEYDGVRWYLNRLPNKTIVRSVKVVGERIYTGSYEEFGFWERDQKGILNYTSLSKVLDVSQIASQSIWDIYEYNNSIIFKSFGSLFIYDFNTVKVISPSYVLMAANVINGKFYVQGIGEGLLTLENDTLVVAPGTEALQKERVQAIISFQNQIFIGTSLNGCYLLNEHGLTKWNSSIDDLLKENQLNTLVYINGKIYFGTIKNGVYEYDVQSDSVINIDVKNGLQNNTVLASMIDKKNNLWLALDNGISSIPLAYYAYYLNPYKIDIGAVYDVAYFNNEIYVATNTGIYKLLENGIEFINGSQGHIWSLTVVDNEIICGHNTGTFSIRNGMLTSISQKNGGYVFMKLPSRNQSYVQANYSGLTIYNKRNGQWESYDVEGLHIPVKNIVFEKDYEAWILHPYKGVFKIYFSRDYKRVERIVERYNNEFTNLYDIKLFEVEGNVAFFTNDSWYVYNPLEDQIESFASMNKVLGEDEGSVVLSKFSDTPLIFKRVDDNTLFMRESLRDSTSQVYLPKKFYTNKLVRGEGEQKAVVVSDSLVYLALYDDVLAFNPQKVNFYDSLPAPALSRAYINGISSIISKEIALRKSDTLRLYLKSQYLSNASLEYHLGNESWKSTDGTITLSGLPYGTTTLKLRSFVNAKNFSPTEVIYLNVKSPWYLGWLGLLALLLLILLIIYAISVINKYVLIKHKKYLDEQYKHEQEIHRKEEALKNEKHVNELLKRQHEIELNAKTKELANTAMEMTKKDELLENLKSDLELFKQEIINKPKFEKLLQTINRNINTSKDWEVFESNFNEIHDSFFKSLVNKHAHLTPKDLKLCAYLKMNLTTKEIAPLMGISARGVEIHRYRLRKKLGLESDQNLNEYFMNIN